MKYIFEYEIDPPKTKPGWFLRQTQKAVVMVLIAAVPAHVALDVIFGDLFPRYFWEACCDRWMYLAVTANHLH